MYYTRFIFSIVISIYIQIKTPFISFYNFKNQILHLCFFVFLKFLSCLNIVVTVSRQRLNTIPFTAYFYYLYYTIFKQYQKIQKLKLYFKDVEMTKNFTQSKNMIRKYVGFIFLFYSLASTTHAQMYKELPLSISDSATSDIDHWYETAFPHHTIEDDFKYDPENPTAPLPHQTWSTSQAFHFVDFYDGYVEYSLITPDVLGDSNAFFLDIYGRSDCCRERDDSMTITFYDNLGLEIYKVEHIGISDDAPYHLRIPVTDQDIDPASKLEKFKIQTTRTDGFGTTFTLMEVRFSKSYQLFHEDTLRICSGTSYELSSYGEATYYNWSAKEEEDVHYLGTLHNSNTLYENKENEDTATFYLEAQVNGFSYTDSIVVISSAGAKIDSVSSSFCTLGNTYTLFANKKNTDGYFSWNIEGVLSETDSINEVTVGTDAYYTITTTDPSYNGLCADSVYLTATGSIGTPSYFGLNEWHAYLYDENDFTNYLGYYTSSNSNISSIDQWDATEDPSQADQYIGCDPSDLEDYTISFKREGFICDYYQININLVDASDEVALYINDNLIGTYQALTNTNVWEGILGSEHTIELKYTNNGATAGIEVTLLPSTFPTDLITTTTYDDTLFLCTGSTLELTSLEDSWINAYNWSTENGSISSGSSSASFSAPTEQDTISVYFSAGCATGSRTLNDTVYVVSTEGIEITNVNLDDLIDGTVDAGDEVIYTVNAGYDLNWEYASLGSSATESGNTLTVLEPNSTNQYIKVSTSQINGASCPTLDSVYYNADKMTIGDTSLFGDFKWFGYLYDKSFETYYGHFTVGDSSTTSFVSRDSWGWDAFNGAANNISLSSYEDNDYLGLTNTNTITNAVIFKRKGFACGYYALDLFTYENRSGGTLSILVNGTLVYTKTGAGRIEPWQGYLDENSTVEVIFVKGSNTFSWLQCYFNDEVQTDDEFSQLIVEPTEDVYYVCSGGTEKDIVVSSTGYTWTELDGGDNTHSYTTSPNSDTLSFTSGNADTIRYKVSLPNCQNVAFSVFDTVTVVVADEALTEITPLDHESSCIGSDGSAIGALSLEAQGANEYSWSSTPTDANMVASNNTLDVAPTETTVYTVTGSIFGSTCLDNDPKDDQVTLSTYTDSNVPFDQDSAGQDEWIVHYYDTDAYQDYYGHYTAIATDDNFGFNTQSDFAQFENPSASLSSNYVGCTSADNDTWSMVARREGFPCGYYTIRTAILNHAASDVVDVVVSVDNGSTETEIIRSSMTETWHRDTVYNVYLDENSTITASTEDIANAFRFLLYVQNEDIDEEVLKDYEEGKTALWLGGANDQDWSNGNNWCGALMPNESRNVYIAPDLTSYPVLDELTPAVKSMYNYGELTIGATTVLNVKYLFDNYGEITSNTGGGVLLDGTLPSKINADTSFSLSKLTINKTDPTSLNEISGQLSISDQLSLQSGLINTSSKENLVLFENATVSDASTDSYVIGPISKRGSGTFTFPVGYDTYFAPLSITPDNTIGSEDTVTVAYYYDNPVEKSTPNYEDTIARVSILEYWDVEVTNETPDYQIALTWDENQKSSGINDLNTLDMAYFNRTSLQWEFIEGTATGTIIDGDLLADNNHSLAGSGMVTFASGIESEILNPLPVSFMRFTAEYLNGSTQLMWITSYEKNNHYFIIERSIDAVHFDSLGFVYGNGFSYQKEIYHFADTIGLDKTMYYRIKQVDFDGDYSYSDIKSASPNGRTMLDKAEFSIYPVPLAGSDILNIKFTESTEVIYNIQLVNSNGKLVLYSELNHSQMIIEGLSYLPSGVYMLRAETSKGVMTSKIIK